MGARARGVRPALPAAHASGWTRSSAASRRCGRCGRLGTKAYDGELVSLPETTCYPRPVGDIPVIVGGSGPRTLRIAATLGDAANVPSAAAAARRAGRHAARSHSETVRVTVLDLPTVGRDRDDTWARVERLRGRTAAAAYAERTHAGTGAQQRDRYGALADAGRRHRVRGARRPGVRGRPGAAGAAADLSAT